MGLKKVGYNIVKLAIKLALHLYFGKIKLSGLQHVPIDKPVLFLPNHQSALIDVLLIAVQCNRKPYFLTRSDVFKNSFLVSVFDFFQMIPIYRIRDGRESLKYNQAVFDRCARLLRQKNAILMFPEANHNLKRRVRPLSKGFTRILFSTLDKSPELDIRIVPVGMNYRDAVSFPDRVALYYGEDIGVRELYNPKNLPASIDRIKDEVGSRLKTLTTHVEDETEYERIIDILDANGVDYLNPTEVNAILKKIDEFDRPPLALKTKSFMATFFNGLFSLLNLPVVLLWRKVLKPKVWEPEFMGTLRFAYALFAFPVYYLLLFTVVAVSIDSFTGFLVVTLLFLFNLAYVRRA